MSSPLLTLVDLCTSLAAGGIVSAASRPALSCFEPVSDARSAAVSRAYPQLERDGIAGPLVGMAAVQDCRAAGYPS